MFGGSSGDALLLTAVKLMTMLLSLVTTRLLSQYLTTYDYGTYSQVLLISSTIASITILGMMDGMNFFFCSEKDTERREAYVATIYLMQLALGVIMGAAVMILTKPICAYMDNPELKKLMLFAAPFAVGTALCQYLLPRRWQSWVAAAVLLLAQMAMMP